MSRGAYYNEFDPFAAQWLRNLISAGHIAPGDVDDRSLLEVRPDDLRGYTQCHFFAGIGVWSYALRRAGWDDDRPVWTGSCPCQPFSNAGKRGGGNDERHLWPAWFEFIRECRPGVVFGEQVEAAIRLGWLDAVQADLESEGYAVGAVGFPAAGVGAPHIRPRLWFVAESGGVAGRLHLLEGEQGRAGAQTGGGGAAGELAHPGRDQPRRRGAVRPADGGAAQAPGGGLRTLEAGPGEAGRGSSDDAADGGAVGFALGNAAGERLPGTAAREGATGRDEPRAAGPVNGFWANAAWIPCRDGRSRPVEPGTFPLAHGAPGRVGRLRAYGNAIVAPAAEAFIRSYREVTDGR